MDILTPKTIPFILVGVAAIFLINYLRHRGPLDESEQLAQRLAQRNRLRMTLIFGIVGAGQLLWRFFGRG